VTVPCSISNTLNINTVYRAFQNKKNMSLSLTCLVLGKPGLIRPSVLFTRAIGSSYYSTTPEADLNSPSASVGGTNLLIGGKSYSRDEQTNVTPRILSHVGRNLHLRPQHPLGSVLLMGVAVLRIRYIYRGSEFFPSQIQGQKDSRIRINEFKYFNPTKIFKLSEI
jgi:hypothetical protein